MTNVNECFFDRLGARSVRLRIISIDFNDPYPSFPSSCGHSMCGDFTCFPIHFDTSISKIREGIMKPTLL